MQFGIFSVGDVTTDPATGSIPAERERIRATVDRWTGARAEEDDAGAEGRL